MRIELIVMFRNSDKARETIVADGLSQLPIPVPSIGEHIKIEVDGTIYHGLINQKEFDLTELDDPEGVLRINLFVDEQSF
jgi:hypothetical protein